MIRNGFSKEECNDNDDKQQELHRSNAFKIGQIKLNHLETRLVTQLDLALANHGSNELENGKNIGR